MMGIVEFQQYDIWVWPENEAFTHHKNGNLRGENGQGGPYLHTDPSTGTALNIN